MLTGFETLGQLDRHYAQLRREAEAWRLAPGATVVRFTLDRMPPLPKLRSLCRAVLAALFTRHYRVSA
jgi:hypothetical protein